MHEYYTLRGRIYRIAVLALFVVLAANLFYLQVPQHRHYQNQALENRLVRSRVKPPRGLIIDRDGVILADNTYIADITIPASAWEPGWRDSTVDRLIRWWDLPPAEVDQRLGHQKEAGRTRLVLVANAGLSRVHAVEEYHHILPGVQVDSRARRRYPHGASFAHLVGYVGEVTPADIGEPFTEDSYRPGDMIGKMGIEAACEDSLRGHEGWRFEEVNAAGRVVRRPSDTWPEVQPEPGRDVTLTLAVALQESLRAVIAGQVGGAIALAIPSGAVLAACSSPSFDPNLLTATISPTDWEALSTDSAKPFFNRVIQGTYAPGSLYKVVTSLCALQHGVIGTETELDPCYGSYRFGDRTFRCWRRAGHGSVDHTGALAQSCDVYYYQLGLRLNIDQLHRAAASFGLGRPCCDVFPEEAGGNIPTSGWYDARFGRRGWTQGVLLNNAIGQGELLVTPIQMALLAAAVATSGNIGRPHFIATPGGADPYLTLPFREEHMRWVRSSLVEAVDIGTGTAAQLEEVGVAGKTGTTENPHGEDHAWFMCYAPSQAPEVALAIILENAGHGGRTAAPLAARWLQSYFAWRAGRSLP